MISYRTIRHDMSEHLQVYGQAWVGVPQQADLSNYTAHHCVTTMQSGWIRTIQIEYNADTRQRKSRTVARSRQTQNWDSQKRIWRRKHTGSGGCNGLQVSSGPPFLTRAQLPRSWDKYCKKEKNQSIEERRRLNHEVRRNRKPRPKRGNIMVKGHGTEGRREGIPKQ